MVVLSQTLCRQVTESSKYEETLDSMDLNKRKLNISIHQKVPKNKQINHRFNQYPQDIYLIKGWYPEYLKNFIQFN